MELCNYLLNFWKSPLLHIKASRFEGINFIDCYKEFVGLEKMVFYQTKSLTKPGNVYFSKGFVELKNLWTPKVSFLSV